MRWVPGRFGAAEYCPLTITFCSEDSPVCIIIIIIIVIIVVIVVVVVRPGYNCTMNSETCALLLALQSILLFVELCRAMTKQHAVAVPCCRFLVRRNVVSRTQAFVLNVVVCCGVPFCKAQGLGLMSKERFTERLSYGRARGSFWVAASLGSTRVYPAKP